MSSTGNFEADDKANIEMLQKVSFLVQLALRTSKHVNTAQNDSDVQILTKLLPLLSSIISNSCCGARASPCKAGEQLHNSGHAMGNRCRYVGILRGPGDQ